MNEVRIADAEREAAAAKLQQHFAAGRLDLTELEARTQRVLAARFQHEIDEQLADMPSRAMPVPEEEEYIELEAVRPQLPTRRGVVAMPKRGKEIFVGVVSLIALGLFIYGIIRGVWWSWLAFIALPGVASLLLLGDERQVKPKRGS